MKRSSALAVALIMALSISAGAADPTDPKNDRPNGWLEALGFGVGFSYTHDLGSEDRIQEAELVNNIVRVTHSRNGVVRPVVETHAWVRKPNADTMGRGPFVALQVGEDRFVSAAALGWMLGMKRGGSADRGFNLGFGFVVDPDTQVLGDDVHENEPPPPGETGVRYKREAQYGFIVVLSFGN